MERDYIGPDPVAWLDRLIEVNAESAFNPIAKGYIEGRLRELQGKLRDMLLEPEKTKVVKRVYNASLHER